MLLHGRRGLFRMTAQTRRLNLNLMFELVLGVDFISEILSILLILIKIILNISKVSFGCKSK